MKKDIKIDQWIIIALTAAIVISGFLQWRVMSGQLAEMRSSGTQTDKLIVEATKQSQAARDAADAAKVSSDAARKAANIAQQALQSNSSSFRLDQRAWVAPIEVKGVPEVGKLFDVTVRVKNTGKTFAKSFSMVNVTEALSGGAEPTFSKEFIKQEASVSVLAPNGEYTSTLHPAGLKGLSQNDLDVIKLGKVKLVIHGRLAYRDVFGCSHWTVYCVKLGSDLNFESCQTHNDSDQNNCH